MNMETEIVKVETFTGFATTEEGQWSEVRLRDEWQRLVRTETRRRKDEAEWFEDKSSPRTTNKYSREVMLETFKPGRFYTAEDVRVRCKVNGTRFSEEAIKHGLRRLIFEKRVDVVAHSTGGKNKVGQIYKLADRDD